MSPKPKYKRGFTWAHHFDEWWDRLGEEFKIKLYLGLGCLVLGLIGIGLYSWHQKSEKDDLLQSAQKHLEAKHSAEMDQARKKLSQRPVPPGTWNPRED